MLDATETTDSCLGLSLLRYILEKDASYLFRSSLYTTMSTYPGFVQSCAISQEGRVQLSQFEPCFVLGHPTDTSAIANGTTCV
jgi:hypothetical protein